MWCPKHTGFSFYNTTADLTPPASPQGFNYDILQKHSINSLVQNDILDLNHNQNDECSGANVLDLQTPRSCFIGESYLKHPYQNGDHSPRQFSTPKPIGAPNARNSSYQQRLKDVLPQGRFHVGSVSTNSNSLSDYSPINSPSLDSPTNFVPCISSLINNMHSPPISDISSPSSPDSAIYNDLLNSMSLSDMAKASIGRANEASNLENMQMLRQLQNPPSPFMNSVFPPRTNRVPDRVTLYPPKEEMEIAVFNRMLLTPTEPTCTWSGVLPSASKEPAGYSSKLFVGGLPYEIAEQTLISSFKSFGVVRTDWPGKEKNVNQPQGFIYLVFESEKNIKALLQACSREPEKPDSTYFKIASKQRVKGKDTGCRVQIIPWALNDANYTKSSSQKLDPNKTVFVGGLHGLFTAEGLALVMDDLFGGVIYAGLDTDKYKYPIGSGRVTFETAKSYFKAISAGYIDIKYGKKSSKKVQIKPYLEDSLCSLCAVQQGPYFCKELLCFRYFCRSCWDWQHSDDLRHHLKVYRSSKNGTASTALRQ